MSMNYDQVVSQSGTTDEDFMSPISSSGEVLVNGAIAQGSLIAAMSNKAPRYPLPSGQSLEMVGRVRRAALVYRFIDENDYLENSFERYSNTTVAGLTSLNGQGHAGEDQCNFMSRIQVIGIAQQDTEENGAKLFNIHIGGVYTMINNSDRDIVAGDWLMAYAPRLDEIKQGGRGKEHDINGYYELWMVPYHPEVHQVTSAHIYACLTQHNEDRDPRHARDGKAFMEEYETMCDILLDSFMDMGIIFLEFMARQGLVQLTSGAGTAKDRVAVYAATLRKIGHTQFFSNNTVVPAIRQEFIDALFLDRLRRDNDSYKKSNYFPGKGGDEAKLRECQLDAVSLGLTEQANFNHLITKNVFAKAVTSGAPKKNLTVQLASMLCSK